MPTPLPAGPSCQAIFHYHTCNCRTPAPFYFCSTPGCPHATPSSLVVSALPFACRSEQTARRGWRQASVPTSGGGAATAVRSLACTAPDPAAAGFTREEDTAERLGDRDIVVLDGYDGLCGQGALDRVVPPFVVGADWRGEVLRRYGEFRDLARGFGSPVAEKRRTAAKDVGVIGDRTTLREPGFSKFPSSFMTPSRQLFETSEPEPREVRRPVGGTGITGSRRPKRSTLDILLDSIPEGDVERRSALAELIRVLGIFDGDRNEKAKQDIAPGPNGALGPTPRASVLAGAENDALTLARLRGSSNAPLPLGMQTSRNRRFSNVFSGLPLPRIVTAPKAVGKPSSNSPGTSKFSTPPKSISKAEQKEPDLIAVPELAEEKANAIRTSNHVVETDPMGIDECAVVDDSDSDRDLFEDTHHHAADLDAERKESFDNMLKSLNIPLEKKEQASNLLAQKLSAEKKPSQSGILSRSMSYLGIW